VRSCTICKTTARFFWDYFPSCTRWKFLITMKSTSEQLRHRRTWTFSECCSNFFSCRREIHTVAIIIHFFASSSSSLLVTYSPASCLQVRTVHVLVENSELVTERHYLNKTRPKTYDDIEPFLLKSLPHYGLDWPLRPLYTKQPRSHHNSRKTNV